jgi:hypothetical protein
MKNKNAFLGEKLQKSILSQPTKARQIREEAWRACVSTAKSGRDIAMHKKQRPANAGRVETL